MRMLLFVFIYINLYAGPPMISQDPFVPALGQFEINLAAEMEDNSRHRDSAFILDINYGLMKNVQFTLAGAFINTQENNDFDATELALKWLFYQNEFISIALNPRYLSFIVNSSFEEDDIFELSIPTNFTINQNINVVLDVIYVKPKHTSHLLALGSYVQYTQNNHNYYLELFVEEIEQSKEVESLLNVGYLYQYNDTTGLMLSLGKAVNGQEETIAYAGLQLVF